MRRASHIALAELEDVFTFIYSRVGNRKDAEVLTLQVALKALPCLRRAGAASAIRGSLFATARIALAEFWSARLNVAKDELLGDPDYCVPESAPSEDSGEVVQRILSSLSTDHRRVLTLRFVDGRSLREVAVEMNSTLRAVKVMQLRALRAAAKVGWRTGARSPCNDQQSGDTAFMLPDGAGGQPSLERNHDPRGGPVSA